MEFSEEVKKAVHIAQALAKEFANLNFGPAHLLKGLLHKDVGLIDSLYSWDVEIGFLEEWAEVRIEEYPKGRVVAEPTGDGLIRAVFSEAENIALKLGYDQTEAVCVLASLSTPGVGFTFEQLKTFPINQQYILEKVSKNTETLKAAGYSSSQISGNQNIGGALLKFATDLVTLAREGKLPAFVGREQEMVTISEILSRHSKPNVILTGGPGVGKTALIKGFAGLIAKGLVPLKLQNACLFELEINTLLSGSGYKGEIEDRLKSFIDELSKFDFPILFIDDIHVLFDKTQQLQGLVNIIKSNLSKGNFTLLATTLTDEFRKKIEPEVSLVRWCEVLPINEPTDEQTVEIAEGALSSFSEYHNVTINKEVIAGAVKLSKRYIKERQLPDAVIDVLDRTMAALGLMSQMSSIWAPILEKITKTSTPENLESDFKKALSQFNFLTLDYIDENPEVIKQGPVTVERISLALEKLKAIDPKKSSVLELAHIASTISKICGIPAGKIMSGERERLVNLESAINSKVIGQEQAVKALADAILESRSGLSRAGQPIGSFFFLGPTGTGKTELAKQLADYLFQSTASLIRFDMSEFKEEHSAALLYGAPPGYVGYEEGGLLVNKIKALPYSVVLFDEIEKAHTSVFDIFLQILDEGKIHDKLGRIGDFSNAVVLFTSNIGSQAIVELFEKKKELPLQSDLATIMSRYFRPEFLGRLSAIVPFAPITKENVIKILKLQLIELEQALKNQDITFTISDKAMEVIANEGYTPEYGARPLRGVIRTRLKTPLARLIISGKLKSGGKVKAEINKKDEFELVC